jgi:Amt family ammonium transporter
VATYLIGLGLEKTIGFRVDDEHELAGVDLVTHAETAYDLHASAGTRTGFPATSPSGSPVIERKVNA